jgi:hypothetical protein
MQALDEPGAEHHNADSYEQGGEVLPHAYAVFVHIAGMRASCRWN